MPDADETTGDLAPQEGQESLLLPVGSDSDPAGVPASEDVPGEALEGFVDTGAPAAERADVPVDDAGSEVEFAEAPQQVEAPESEEAFQPVEEPESAETEPTATAGEEDASEEPEPDASADEAAGDLAPEPVYELDPVLAASEDRAREALADITPADTIGPLVATLAHGEHVVSLQFANLMRGYPGWLWTATLSRIDETEDVNVLEVELLPGEGAVLAPDWVPWTDRLADYRAAQDAAGEELEDDEDADDEASDDEGADDEGSDDEDADAEDEFDDQVVLDDDEDDSDDDEDDSDDDESDGDEDDDDDDRDDDDR